VTEALTLEPAPAGAHIGGMQGSTEIAEVAALVGDPARANILCALLDGRALTAGELAYSAGVSPQTTSGHLAKLTGSKLLSVVRQGRHRYYRIAGAHVGRMLESIMDVAVAGPPRYRPRSGREQELRHARTCYDHLAGLLGVGLTDRLCARAHLVLGEEGGEVTEPGRRFLTTLGVDLAGAQSGRRVFCRPCLDWTERRPHLGGAVGAALAARCFDLGWIERQRSSRAVVITHAGRRGFLEAFGLSV
jgi:DNA-binding transcriptional ArsR family regulator